MNIHDLEKEMETVQKEIADFREKSRTAGRPADVKAWIAEEKRLLKKEEDIDLKMCEYYRTHKK
jgi:hypothetical protein